MGGSKISTKINLISNLIQKVNNLIIVGAMANNFFLYNNLRVGKSLIEKDTKKIIEGIYKEAEKSGCKILLPIDCVVGKEFDGIGKNKKS